MGGHLVLPRVHAGQAEWYNRPERFIVVAAGTKGGKTYGAVLWLLARAWSKPDAVCWWVAPVFGQARIAYRLMRRLLNRCRGPNGQRLPFTAVDGRLEILLPNGTLIAFKSAENPDNLYGEGVFAAVFDEASRAREESWHALRSTLTFTRGRCLLIANAKGKRNFFFQLYTHGRDPEFPEFFSIRQPTTSNPWIPQSELDQAARVLPERVYRELYLAEFLDESAGVFAGWSECVVGELSGPDPDRHYVIGADFGRKMDWSVFTVLDAYEHHVCHIHRTQQPWTAQVQTLANLSERFNDATVFGDATGVGDPVVEMAEEAGVYVEPVVLTPRVKSDIIVRLQGAFEHQDITIPDVEATRILRDELDIFTYDVTPSGHVRYTAPSGYHDDCVLSLALGVHGLAEETGI